MTLDTNDPIVASILATRNKLNPRDTAPIWKEPTMNNTADALPGGKTATPKAERPVIAKGAYKSKAAASRSVPDKDLPPRDRLHQTKVSKKAAEADDVPRSKVKAVKSTVVDKPERKPEHGRATRAQYEDADAVSPKEIAKHMKMTPKAVRTVLRRIEDKIPAALRVKGPRWGFTDVDSIAALIAEHTQE